MSFVDARGRARILKLVVVAAAVIAAAVFAGPRLLGALESETELGTVSIRATAGLGGHVSAYVPVTDWGLRTDAFDAPLEIGVELRSLDRDGLIRAAGGDRAILSETVDQLRAGALRAILLSFAAIAGLAMLLALAVALALGGGWRSRLPAAVAAGVIACCGGTLAATLITFDTGSFDRPTYYARGAELAKLIAAVDREQGRGGYSSSFERVLRGLSNYLANEGAGGSGKTRTMLLGSDLHNNTLVLRPVDRLAGSRPLIFAGDFGHTGSAAEARVLSRRFGELDARVIGVSGNHDSQVMMDALAEAGVEVLDERNPTTRARGLRIAGWPDPLQGGAAGEIAEAARDFSFEDNPDPAQAAELRRAAEAELLRWFEALDPAPDVAIVHQNGLAQSLAEALAERGYERPLTILTGHDHAQHIDLYGPIAVVDAGTMGAAGLFGVASEFAGLAELHFEPGRPLLRSVDLIRIEPISGRAAAERVVIASLCPDEERCTYEPEQTVPESPAP